MDKMNPILKYFLYFCFFVMGGFLLLIIYGFFRAIFGTAEPTTVASNSPNLSFWDRIISFLGIKESAPKQTTSNTVENPTDTFIKSKIYPTLYEAIEEIRCWYGETEYVIPKGSYVYAPYDNIKKMNPLTVTKASVEEYNNADNDSSKWVDFIRVLFFPDRDILVKVSSLKVVSTDVAKEYFDMPKVSMADWETKALKVGEVFSIVINEDFICKVSIDGGDYFFGENVILKTDQKVVGKVTINIPQVFDVSKIYLDKFRDIVLDVKIDNKTYQIPSSKIKIIESSKSIAI